MISEGVTWNRENDIENDSQMKNHYCLDITQEFLIIGIQLHNLCYGLELDNRALYTFIYICIWILGIISI